MRSEKIPLNFEELVKRFKAYPFYDLEKGYGFSQYVGFFGELHLDRILETLIPKLPGFDLDPELECYLKNKNFHMNYTPGKRCRVRPLDDNLPNLTEYDRLGLLEKKGKNHFVRFEVKVSAVDYSKLMNPKFYEHRNSWLYKILNEKMGYFVLIPVSANGGAILSEENFIKKNGYVSHLQCNAVEFRELVRENVEKYRLKVNIDC